MASRTDPATQIGGGLYSVADAARLLQVPSDRVRRWLRTLDGAKENGSTDFAALSFVQLMELHFIRLFREQGVSMQAIRKASHAAAERFGARYPFAVKRFDTDGKTIFATLIREQSDRPQVEDLRKGQYVFDHVMRPFFRKLEYDQGEVSRYWPRDRVGRVVLDPNRSFGRPLDAETGVPTRALYDAFLAGDGQDVQAVARWFEVPVQAVRAAIDFEQFCAA